MPHGNVSLCSSSVSLSLPQRRCQLREACRQQRIKVQKIQQIIGRWCQEHNAADAVVHDHGLTALRAVRICVRQLGEAESLRGCQRFPAGHRIARAAAPCEVGMQVQAAVEERL
jgi:hypothetical protein